ncbi:MAG: protein kinase domain-containing protein [Thermoanaerobaculia bacterium]
MLQCPGCSASLGASDNTCPICGMPVEGTLAPTLVDGWGPRPLRVPRKEEDAPDFTADDLLAGRYRVVGLLGRGGMGEVYQVEDLKLGQTVALKFLPERLARNGAALARFHREVRLARQVSHPNVCRVFDVGEARGRPFLSMEFIEGEDLSFLLRHGGPLARDRTVEIAYQLCAGLAAIHDAGVLHRDLKPSNVMIDARGRARITDFGVAALAGEMGPGHARAGTLAYMAPEQMANGDVSAQSDLYSLGLVLYEIFTGRRAFEAHGSAGSGSRPRMAAPSALVVDLDPSTDRTILRCLERDPRDRPPSAMAVALALPGGNPMAAALADGEVPSPEMVVSAPGFDRLRPAVGAACLAGVAGLLLALVLLSDGFMAHRQVPLPHPPAVLAARTRALLDRLGYPDPPAQSAYGFEVQEPGSGRGVPRFRFWYRESPQPLRPAGPSVMPADPPLTLPGEVSVLLDTEGRLLGLEAVPRRSPPAARPGSPPDWPALLRAAGFDPARTVAAPPLRIPRVFADGRSAWVGRRPGLPPPAVRIEAASYEGRPVSFQVLGVSEGFLSPAMSLPATRGMSFSLPALAVPLLFLLILLLTRGHLRLGLGDLNSAWRLAIFLFSISLLSWLLAAKGLPTWNELVVLSAGAAIYWCLYMAVEPLVRRRWPAKIISWKRLLAGHIRDPRVGRDLLVGSLLGLGIALVYAMEVLIPGWAGDQPRFRLIDSNSLLGAPGVMRQLCVNLEAVFSGSIGIVAIFLVLHRILRRESWALSLLTIFYTGVMVVLSHSPWLWLGCLAAVLKAALFLFIWLRFGLLVDLVTRMIFLLVLSYPLTSDPAAWYRGTSLFVVLAVTGLATYGFAMSTAGRPLLREVSDG